MFFYGLMETIANVARFDRKLTETIQEVPKICFVVA